MLGGARMILVPLQLVAAPSHKLPPDEDTLRRAVSARGQRGRGHARLLRWEREAGGGVFIAPRHTLPPTPASGRLVNKTKPSILDFLHKSLRALLGKADKINNIALR